MPSCASTRRSSEMRAPMAAIESSLQRLKSAIRSRGTLRTWAMTSTGSGTAKSATSSISPAPIHPSISRSTIADDRIAQRRDRPRREVRRHRPAVAGLRRRVHREHGRDLLPAAAHDLPQPLDHGTARRFARVAEPVRERPRIAQDRDDQLVPGDEVEVGALDGEDGARLLHGPVVRVRALLHGGVERVEVVQVDRRCGPGSLTHGAACWHAARPAATARVGPPRPAARLRRRPPRLAASPHGRDR